MADFLADYRQVLLALHIIAFISWMAGMLYLPRLFVYHADVEPGSVTSSTFKIMEHRLLKAITTPAMLATWIFGLALMWGSDFSQLKEGWMHGKLLCVILLTGMHGMFAATVKRFAHDRNERPAKFYRIVNEIPTLLMIAIVFLVMVVRY